MSTSSADQRITLRDIRQFPTVLLASGFGAGLSPFAPGTVGTLVGIVFVLVFAPLGPVWFGLATLLVTVSGIYICGNAAKRLGVHDHGGIVWDEIAGYMITVLFVPVTPVNLLLAFILFRIADIAKPWPVNLIDDKVPGGLGIMLDDVAAGIYAAAATTLVVWWL